MAVSAKNYGNVLKHFVTKKIDWVADTIKVALCSSLYVFNQDTHEFFSSITNELAAGGGYTAGGFTLAGKSVTYDAASNETRMLATDVSVPAATFTARYGIIYFSTGVAATSILIGWVDFGVDMAPNNGTFSITWDVTGAAKITATP